MNFLKYIFRFLFWSTTLMVDAIIRPDASLSIPNGEGFVAYLEAAEGFGEIKNCFFKFQGDDKVQIDLNSSQLFKTKRNENVFPFARNLCGIKVFNVSSISAGTWTLEAESLNGVYENDSISIKILPQQKRNFDTRLQLEMGKSTVSCQTRQQQTSQCKLFNILNGETYHQCQLHTTVHPHSMFECFMSDWGHMDPIHERIFVDIKNSTIYTNSTQTSLADAIVLACEFQDTIISSCQAEKPNNKPELLIMDGLYNGRYSAYKTITSKSTCNLEIPKPFLENDIGLWRIINYDSLIPSGCLFYVGKSKADIILEELRKTNKVEVIEVYETVKEEEKLHCISCTVPFIVHDCYLKSPNNTVYFPDDESFSRERLFGKCAFYDMPVMAGIWKCGARGRDHDKEIVQNIEVAVKSRLGTALTKTTKAKRNETVELMCKSSFEEPISHCAFIDPQGNVHLVGTRNSLKSKGRVQYCGRGIRKGECGIKITNINQDDFGQWHCQFTINADRLKSYFLMVIEETATVGPLSIGLGIGVGLAVICILVMGVFIGTMIYRRRNLTACHNFASTNPLELPTRSATSS